MDERARIVESVRRSRKYRHVAPDLIRSVADVELAKGRSVKEAIKATKSQLHQSAAAYLAPSMDYDGWLAQLARVYTHGDEETVRTYLRQIMEYHASTRERLPTLATFYETIFAQLPPIHSIVDVACGLNPLAHPWMPLPADTRYDACDIFADQIQFLNRFFALAGVHGRAEVRDVLHDPPTQRVDLALVLKTIPCLEQFDRTAGERLLDALNARFLVVSFPVRSLGGRAKGMVETYTDRFTTLVGGRNWRVQRLDLPDELVFCVETTLR